MSEEARGPMGDLLAQRRALEELALRMSGRREDADELVQEALLVALERPPRGDGDRGAWLRGVLRHLWHRNRRRAARDRATELDPTLPAESSPAGANLERSETAARLARSVLELDEPYRSVLFLRYYEDRTPSEIAAELGRPLNTITSQLARGLDRLRERLALQRGDERVRRDPWALLGWLRGEKRDRAQRPAGSLSTASRAMVAGVVCCTALVIIAWRGEWRRDASDEVVAVAPPATSQGTPVTAASGVREGLDASEVVQTDGWFELEVVDDADEPVAGAQVRLSRVDATFSGNPKDYPTPIEGRTDDRGRLRASLADVLRSDSDGSHIMFSLDEGSPLEVAYQVHVPPWKSCSLRIHRRERSVTLRGKLLDPKGAGMSGAMLHIASEPPPQPLANDCWLVEAQRTVFSDVDGRYDASLLTPGLHMVWIIGDGAPAADWVDARRGAVLERDFMLRAGSTLSGTVVDANGAPVPGALVRIEYERPGLSSSGGRTYASRDGKYRVRNLPTGSVRAIAEDPSNPARFDTVFLQVTEVGEVEWNPELREREPLRLHVQTSDERAFIGFVIVTRPDPEDAWHRVGPTDSEGRVTFTGLPPGAALEVDVYRTADILDGGPPCFTVHGIAAGPGICEIVVPRERLGIGGLTGRVVGASAPLSRLRLQLRAFDSRRFRALHVSPRDGKVHRPSLTSQRYTAVLECDGLGVMSLGEIAIVAGETRDLGDIPLPPLARVEIDWRWAETAPGFELVAFTESADAATPPMEWRVIAGSTVRPDALTLLPGRYRWTVTGAGRTLEQREFEVAPGEGFLLETPPLELRQDAGR